MSNNCYRFERISQDKNLFNVDATYILTMENSNRKKQFMEQINKFSIGKNIFIQYNKGYKKCKKKMGNESNYINKTYIDLFHAYINIFKHAKNNNFKTILTLEDDFIISNKINEKDIKNINNFIPLLNKNNYVLRLGTCPGVTRPCLKNLSFRRLYYGLGAHALIIPNTIFDSIINKNKNLNEDWDWYMNKYKQYMYYKPLVYQVYENTDNQKLWGETNGLQKLVPLVKFYFKITKLDKQIEPGTSILYIINDLIYIIIPIILVLFLIIKIIIKINKTNKLI
jgi:hypothetical protein